jgi:hypothetical protein
VRWERVCVCDVCQCVASGLSIDSILWVSLWVSVCVRECECLHVYVHMCVSVCEGECVTCVVISV